MSKEHLSVNETIYSVAGLFRGKEYNAVLAFSTRVTALVGDEREFENLAQSREFLSELEVLLHAVFNQDKNLNGGPAITLEFQLATFLRTLPKVS